MKKLITALAMSFGLMAIAGAASPLSACDMQNKKDKGQMTSTSVDKKDGTAQAQPKPETKSEKKPNS